MEFDRMGVLSDMPDAFDEVLAAIVAFWSFVSEKTGYFNMGPVSDLKFWMPGVFYT